MDEVQTTPHGADDVPAQPPGLESTHNISQGAEQAEGTGLVAVHEPAFAPALPRDADAATLGAYERAGGTARYAHLTRGLTGEYERAGATAEGPHPDAYTRPQQRLHWIVAALVLAQLAGGLWMSTIPHAGHAVLLHRIVLAHVANGTLIFGLVAYRLMLRRRLGVPEEPAGTPVDVAALAHSNHTFFYVLLLTLPVLGWMTFLTHGQNHHMFGTAHAGTALVLALAICAHLAGVAYHTFVRRDGLLRRMTG
jgi:cytochrome b561